MVEEEREKCKRTGCNHIDLLHEKDGCLAVNCKCKRFMSISDKMTELKTKNEVKAVRNTATKKEPAAEPQKKVTKQILIKEFVLVRGDMVIPMKIEKPITFSTACLWFREQRKKQ